MCSTNDDDVDRFSHSSGYFVSELSHKSTNDLEHSEQNQAEN
jgi:hypothetical protein